MNRAQNLGFSSLRAIATQSRPPLTRQDCLEAHAPHNDALG
ncbi:hypothetical protein OCAR_4300 [Afipia carboxidovorans OM5]|nr:hypothetical protein OCAR_4300 [Afipia carboxidovorans OM5]